MNPLGRHVLVELYECAPAALDDFDLIEASMRDAANAIGATIVNATFHHFAPQGVSGAVVVAESHLSIHTWPEFGYAAVDIFTCGDTCDPHKGVDLLAERLASRRVEVQEVARGREVGAPLAPPNSVLSAAR